MIVLQEEKFGAGTTLVNSMQRWIKNCNDAIFRVIFAVFLHAANTKCWQIQMELEIKCKLWAPTTKQSTSEKEKRQRRCFINIFGQLTNKSCSLNVWYRTLVILIHFSLSFNFNIALIEDWEARKQVWQKVVECRTWENGSDQLIDWNQSFPSPAL